MKEIIAAVTVSILLILTPLLNAEETEGALKEEMRLLTAAYKNLIDAIVLDRPETIEGPFHAVHMAKMNTEKALRAGRITLPKNGDQLEAFAKRDEAFHDKLKKLLGAARRKDRAAIMESAHEILNGCITCHDQYMD